MLRMNPPMIQEALSLTPQMMVVLLLLGFTIVLFVTEVVRVDVAAVSVMVLLGLLSMIPALDGMVDTHRIFAGFGSNAVVSIIAVMIIGSGLDRTGVMSSIARWIMRIGGYTERRLIPIISGTVGLISGFMQNIGAAALFLPVVSRVSSRSGLPMSRLLIPMGFCAIMGGTLTMVGSSPLILLNDLLPSGMEKFELFDVAPIGVAMLTTGILYFVLFGRFVLPSHKSEGSNSESTMDYFRHMYGLPVVIREVRLKSDSISARRKLGEVEKEYGVVVIATYMNGEMRVGPWSGLTIEPRARLAVMGSTAAIERFSQEAGCELLIELDVFSDTLSHAKAGIAEVVIPPNSHLIGKTVTDVAMRKTYGLSVLAIHRGKETIREGRRDIPLQSGDTLVCHCAWDALGYLESDRDFVIITSDYPREELRPQKVSFALAFFALAIGLIIFTDLKLSIALLAGAMGMILSGVLSMDEAYRSVSWRTVFLLASLIPLGTAMEDTGAAGWIAFRTLSALGEVHPLVLQVVIASLATVFTLVMSNVGATVLLVPLAVNIAITAGQFGIDADPRMYALMVAIMTSNAFFIPTHQVNALIMGPGGYRVKDFMKAGGIMTALFLVVGLTVLNWMF